ncbi:MAG: C_GCAxxG_C_C family protein [Clostridia bacterium]|nr:C_GCAxxG_C_C family protein [Clostridia bacterium]
MNHKEKAREFFVQGYNCSQAVVGAYCDVTGQDLETALKLSSSFGAGMGKMRSVCGAVTGMFMVAGLLYGNTEPDDKAKGEHYALIQQLAEKFKEKYDTIICLDLLKGLKTDTKPQPAPRDEEYYKARSCLRFVEEACDILDELIESRV